MICRRTMGAGRSEPWLLVRCPAREPDGIRATCGAARLLCAWRPRSRWAVAHYDESCREPAGGAVAVCFLWGRGCSQFNDRSWEPELIGPPLQRLAAIPVQACSF